MRKMLRAGLDTGYGRPGCSIRRACYPRVSFHAAAAILLTLIALWIQPALAQDDGHSRFHHYYQEWKQPGTQASCCNARIVYPGGAELGDCEPTRAEMRNGDWYAWERHTSRWLKIPDNKVLRERNPSVEEGHLCWSESSGVLCFVPPDTGG